MFHVVNMCFKKFYFEQCILKINIKKILLITFLDLEKFEFIHSPFTFSILQYGKILPTNA